ncbi:histidine kinase [Ideonella sp.]|uniref:histidine kinase n=1 Tax=Ideonella sp. TaxID=1929293 RepID=UPI002B47058C|nr:histidine kinase [Ideonella sp.]HJV69463.1 histidine kinase [Ideonella sp.]
MSSLTATPPPGWASRWQRFSAAAVRAFHAYGSWLASISWWRFGLLSLALIVIANILQDLPPFTWTYTETVVEHPGGSAPPKPPVVPKVPKVPHVPGVRIDKPASGISGSDREGVDISIDHRGVRISPRGPAAASAAEAASAPASAASSNGFSVKINGEPVVEISAGDQDVRIAVPPGANSQEIRQAVQEARQAVIEAIAEAEQARDDAAQARDDIEEALAIGPRVSQRKVRYGESLPQLAVLWILLSALIKATYKARIQAEHKAAVATETAEAEQLRRQVVEARMAAMQAQVEPHFLFNTLASIDHLIETDPARASQMQKNLIALLRASMPTMRDTADGGPRDLGRELAVVQPYVEILKVRMEERLAATIDVPEGLRSAEFPAMMIQTLVENSIRHGLEPKPEGGALTVRAEIVHGRLQVTVADTGVGFGNGGTSGTGVGLANIRERLQLLYGDKATLTVAANQPSGTIVTITVPYRTVNAPGAGNGTGRANDQV